MYSKESNRRQSTLRNRLIIVFSRLEQSSAGSCNGSASTPARCATCKACFVTRIYFRGFLYPRMGWMGKATPFVNTLLFSICHFWSTWQMITRFIAILPFCFVVYRKKNIKIAIIVHCLLNIFGDSVMILMLYLQA